MRNVFWGFFLFCMTIITGCHSSELNPEKTIRFAVFADVQYCSIHEELNGRHYMLAKEQLAEAIRQINEKKPDFVLNLGDLIDHKWENYPVILAELDNLQAPLFSVVGNHDFSVPENRKLQVFAKLEMPAPYYMFRYGQWRFLALNTSDVSLHAWPKNSDKDKNSQEIIAKLYPREKQRGFNGGYSNEQLMWINAQLQEAYENNEKVVIFQHCPVFSDNPAIAVLNPEKLLALIDRYPDTVQLCLSGHHHPGGNFVYNNIPFKTVKGQVEASTPTWIMIEIKDDKISIQGFGDEENSTQFQTINH